MHIVSGIDIIEVETIKGSILRYGERFLNRAFTESEIAYCQQKPNIYQRYAGRIAAKEAAFKAFKTGWANGLQWKQIEILSDGNGAPYLNLLGGAKERFNESNFIKSEVSISHCKHYATAMVIFYGNCPLL